MAVYRISMFPEKGPHRGLRKKNHCLLWHILDYCVCCMPLCTLYCHMCRALVSFFFVLFFSVCTSVVYCTNKKLEVNEKLWRTKIWSLMFVFDRWMGTLWAAFASWDIRTTGIELALSWLQLELSWWLEVTSLSEVRICEAVKIDM